MLTSVHIKNFRSCKDVKIDDMGPMLGLVGRNGAGKTTILRAIEWAASTALSTKDFSNLLSEVDLGDALAEPRAEVEFRVGENEYRYAVGRELEPEANTNGKRIDRDRESLFVKNPESRQWISLVRRMDDVVTLVDRGQQIEINLMAGAMPALASLLPESDPIQVHLRGLVSTLSGIRYYLGHGVVDPAYPLVLEQGGPISKLAYDKWVETNGQAAEPFPSLLLRLIHAYETAPDTFAELKSRLGTDGLGLLEDIRVTTLESSKGPGRARSYYDVMFVPAGLNVELLLSQLSGGTRQMLYLMLALLLDKSSTMLIEQPEDGIHPALLAKLIDIFRVNADPTQIILTSHSPTVLSSLEPADVRLVEMRDGSTRVRALTEAEVLRAQEYMQREGTLAEFLELIQED